MPRENLPKFKIKFEIRDLWVGVYWTIHQNVIRDWVEDSSSMTDYSARMTVESTLKIYICVLPMFPITITKQLKPRTV